MRWCALRWCACARRCAREWHAVRLAPRAGAPRLRVQGPSSSLHRPRSPAQMYIEVLELPCGYLRSVHAEITCLNPCKLLCATFPPRQVLPCHPKHRHHCRPAHHAAQVKKRAAASSSSCSSPPAAAARRAQRPSSHSGAQRRRAAPPLAREWSASGATSGSPTSAVPCAVVSAPRASSRVQGRPDGPRLQLEVLPEPLLTSRVKPCLIKG